MDNKLFYILAGGPSYLDVTEDEWKYLEDKHTITFTRVPYGSRKTEYYVSIERYHIDETVLRYMAKLEYLDTKLLLYIPDSIKLARELGFNKIRKILKRNFYFMPSRRPWFVDEENPPNTFDETMASNFHQPLFRYRGQLNAVINACLILGADEIRLIGVDLNDQLNFYQYPDILNRLCRDEKLINEYLKYNKEVHERDLGDTVRMCDGFNQQTMHSTNVPLIEDKWDGRKMRGIADVIQWIDIEMKKRNKSGIYVCNKNSLLYKQNKLEYRSITDGFS